jgi:REP element-mobilizing transposase RayT
LLIDYYTYLSGMAYSYNITDQGAVYFITCTVVNWVDVFTRKDYADIVEDSLNFCIEKKGLIVYGYAIMSNHVHLLIQAKNNNLSDVLRDFKKFTSQRITDAIEKNKKESRKRWMLWLFKQAEDIETKQISYHFWRSDNHAMLCYSLPFTWQKLDYIHNNPVRAEIVHKAEEYKRSSAADYYYGKQKGKVKVDFLDALITTV